MGSRISWSPSCASGGGEDCTAKPLGHLEADCALFLHGGMVLG